MKIESIFYWMHMIRSENLYQNQIRTYVVILNLSLEY